MNKKDLKYYQENYNINDFWGREPKKWGNSWSITVPFVYVIKDKLKVNDKINVVLLWEELDKNMGGCVEWNFQSELKQQGKSLCFRIPSSAKALNKFIEYFLSDKGKEERENSVLLVGISKIDVDLKIINELISKIKTYQLHKNKIFLNKYNQLKKEKVQSKARYNTQVEGGE